MIVGFEIRRGHARSGACMWGDCIVREERQRREQGRGMGFAEVVILGRASFPACRRHRREIDEILCSLLPDAEAEVAA